VQTTNEGLVVITQPSSGSTQKIILSPAELPLFIRLLMQAQSRIDAERLRASVQQA